MNRIQFVVLSVLVIWSASALRLGGEHQQISNTNDYLQGLLNQQTQFQNQINNLDAQLNQTVTAATAANDIQSKINILEQGILNQQNQIFIASTKIIPKLVIKDQCTNITDAERQRLIQKCDTTITDLQALLAKLQTLPQDARIQQMQASANHQIYYLSTIQKVLRQNCTSTTTLSPTAYQSNIYAPNWITGNQTINDIVAQYIARSQQFDNITNCPLDHPFYDGKACINCADPQPIFDMKLLRCVNCPSGQAFDVNSKVCKEVVPLPPNATNPAYLGNTTGPVPLQSPYDVLCPTNAPYFNGVNCTSCPQQFDFTTLTCTQCANGTVFNSTSRTCQTLQPNANNPIANGTLLGTPVLPQGTIPCPVSTPYYTPQGCIQCFSPSNLFNQTSLQCTSCPSGTFYSPTTASCVQSPPNATNLAATNGNYVGPTPVSSPNDIPCPPTYPFFNGTACISCPSTDPLFNTSTRTCTRCPTSTTFDNTTHSCVKVANVTNLAAYTQMPVLGSFPPQTPYDVPCPLSAPIFYNGQCLNAQCPPTHPLLDVTNAPSTITCASCPNNTVYNATTRACDQLVLQPTGSNLVGQNRTVGTLPATAVPCPTSQPFFNGTACINCYDPTPLFNATSLQCTSACTGGYYNSTDNKCYYYNANNPGNMTSVINPATPVGNAVYCPAATPYFNGTTCIGCPINYPYFNQTSGLCVNCPNGTLLNTTSHQCQVLKPNATNIVAVNSTIGPIATAGPNDIPCPTTAPYYVNGQCIPCLAPNNLFNATSRTCTSCPANTAYNTTTHSCTQVAAALPYTSNLNALNWVSASPFKDKVETAQAITNGSKQACPLSSPYFNGQQCIYCSSPQYFNVTNLRCETCPAGTTWTPNVQKCVLNTSPYITNPNTATNLVYGDYPASQWKSWYNNNKTATPSPQDCVAPKPYYNGQICISCADPYPYFDLYMKDCVRCPTGYNYNNGQCISTSASSLSPNLASMAATAFTHEAVNSIERPTPAHQRHRIM